MRQCLWPLHRPPLRGEDRGLFSGQPRRYAGARLGAAAPRDPRSRARPGPAGPDTGDRLDRDLGRALADDPLAPLLGLGLHGGNAVVHGGHRAADHHLLTQLSDPAELNRQSAELLRSSGRVGMRPCHLGHRPQPVEDAAGQPHLLGEPLVDVDGIEVARGSGVAHGDERVRSDLELDGVALVHDAPLTIWVHVPVHTVSSRWFLDTVSNTKKPISLRSEMSLTLAVVVISSPATTTGPHTNSWPACSIRAKSIPTSGSRMP